MNRDMKNKGFTMIELLIAIAVLTVLTGLLVPSVSKYCRKAKESRYIAEAKQVFEAVKFYLLEKDEAGELDGMTVFIDLMFEPRIEDNKVLRPYLNGKFSKDASISGVLFGETLDSYDGIEYEVDNYVILVHSNGNVDITKKTKK